MRRAHLAAGVLLVLVLLPVGFVAGENGGPAPAGAGSVVVDSCDDMSGWSAQPADGVQLELGTDRGFRGRALRLDFRFQGGGWAIARKELSLDLPENYEFSFLLRGDAPSNSLEFKLIDASGQNVWWSVRRDFQFPAEWQRVVVKKRQISFAWGPQGGGEIRHVAALELAITAGSGGTGTVWIDELRLRPLPPADATPPPPVAGASSALAGHPAAAVLDGDPGTFWAPAAGDGQPWLTLDLGQLREYGGLVVDWVAGRPARDYEVEISDDGTSWHLAQSVTGSNGGRDYVYLPESESRLLRLRPLRAESPEGPAVTELTLEPLAWSASREAFFAAVAQDAPLGCYPRALRGQQPYWTVVGVDGDAREALFSEDGALETGRRRFSVEPFLRVADRLVTWADVEAAQSQAAGYLPVPTVTWRHGDLELAITAFGRGHAGASSVVLRYRVRNHGAAQMAATLYLALRPFQVNPPMQFLNTPGGTAPVHEIAQRGLRILVDGEPALESLTRPAGFGAATFAGGDVVADFLRQGRLPGDMRVRDPFGAASAALAFPLDLAPGAEQEVDLLVPLYPAEMEIAGAGRHPACDAASRRWVAGELARCESGWRRKLERVTIELPGGAADLVATLRSQLAYVLINRAGPAIQPGPRSYARSWIRDGALTGSALLRLGLPGPVRDYLEWYAPYQYASGKIPCVVDARGADPVPEHDSSGEFVFLVAEYYRYTGDRDLAARMWPRIAKAVDYLDALRRERLTAEYRSPDKAEFYGILPPSISHEGYSAQPMHSYWDDLWALRGFRDAAFLAAVLGRERDRARLSELRDTFQQDLRASVEAAMRRHAIDYVPGCADLGDFDPTATTIALSPVAAGAALPAAALERTFARYDDFFRERAAAGTWEVYTPYEIRNVGAFVRLGWRARAHELLAFFLAHRRPAGWHQWAEVVYRDVRAPHFIGDMPHTWVGTDYARSLLDMLAYLDEGRQTLVLGAGILPEWLAGEGVTVRNLPTPCGKLSFAMKREGEGAVVRIEGGLHLPPGGIAVRAPLAGPPREISVHELPVTLRLRP